LLTLKDYFSDTHSDFTAIDEDAGLRECGSQNATAAGRIKQSMSAKIRLHSSPHKHSRSNYVIAVLIKMSWQYASIPVAHCHCLSIYRHYHKPCTHGYDISAFLKFWRNQL
jgi:hypothetical protein